MSEAALERMRAIIQEDVGRRGLCTHPTDNLITACATDFSNACRSIARHADPSVAVVTGFFIPTAEPPAGETDGPLGAVFLARALVPLGIRVTLATDDFCKRALEAGLAQCGLDKQVRVITLPSFAECVKMTSCDYWQRFREQSGPLTHLVALERVGPNYECMAGDCCDDFDHQVPAGSRGRCHTMRGRDITDSMSPAHWLFEQAPGDGVVTIGIGDGGNEIGMGKIAWNIVRRNITRGGLVACRVPTEHLIVAGISNWGAYGLAVGVLKLRECVPQELFDIERERVILQTMVERGPLVDGVLGTQTASVDGLSFEKYATVLPQLGAILSEPRP